MSSRIPERKRSSPLPGSHNVFFALWPSDSVRSGIAAAAEALRRELAPVGRWVAPPRYHMTLHFLGNHTQLAPDFLARAAAAGAAIEAMPFEFSLDVVGSFRNRSIPWWLGCARVPPALQELSSKLGAALDAADLPTSGASSFVPHVTLLRDAKTAAPPRTIAPIAWPADDFVLVDSVLGANSSYTIVHRWPLSPR